MSSNRTSATDEDPLAGPESRRLFERARRRIPGGVNSPARSFASVGGTPLFIEEARGARITDVDGNDYVDYVGSWGPMLLGHAHPRVVEAVEEASERSTSFGAPCRAEVRMAELIAELVPSVEVVRMVNSGTEATMSAIRLARGYTGRSKIVKFEGHYHGHGDSFLIDAGSGPLSLGTPDSPGVTEGTARDTLTAPFNDLDAVEEILDRYDGEVAAIILEPVAGNMGCIPPADGFLEGLRRLCTERDVVLVFDEVMTGFRIAPGGAQERFEVTPDLTTLGKVIGGGLPVGAYGGKKEIMAEVAPDGPVYQAGTLSGNPLAMAAGLATLREIRDRPALYEDLEAFGRELERGMRANLEEAGVPHRVSRVGSMGSVFFTDRSVEDYEDARACDRERYAAYFRGMLEEGVYLAPSPFEAFFLSAAHGDAELTRTLEAQRAVLKSL